MAVAVYVRVSTDDQAEKDTIQIQRGKLEQWARLHDLDICAEYADDGVSGALPLDQRPGGLRLLQDARAGKFNTVAVYRMDRFARNTRHTLNAVAELERLGVRIVSCSENFDTSTPAGRLMLEMLASFASFERQSILERTGQGMQKAAAEGVWMGGIVPYGYRVVGQDREARLVVNDEPIPSVAMSEAQVIRWIFNHIANDRGTLTTAARHLNLLGIPPRATLSGRATRRKSGAIARNEWHVGTISRIIHNTTYRGVHGYGKRGCSEVIERECPAIVSPEVWERANRQLEANSALCRRNSKREYLLSGMMRCGAPGCGYTYIGRPGTQKNGKESPYYTCGCRLAAGNRRSEHQQTCSNPSVPSSFESTLWKQVYDFITNPSRTLQLIAESLRVNTADAAQLATEREQLESRLAGKDEEKDMVLQLYRQKIIPMAKVEQQFQEIDAQANAIRDQLDALSLRLRGLEADCDELSDVADMLEHLREEAESGTFEGRRRCCYRLIKSMTVYRHPDTGKARVVARFLFDTRSELSIGSTRGFPARISRQLPLLIREFAF